MLFTVQLFYGHKPIGKLMVARHIFNQIAIKKVKILFFAFETSSIRSKEYLVLISLFICGRNPCIQCNFVFELQCLKAVQLADQPSQTEHKRNEAAQIK